MRHIGRELKRTFGRTRATERGEIMKYFCERLNSMRRIDGYPPITLGRMGKMLEKVPTKDLYYMKSSCDQSDNFSKRFWWLLNPEKYEKGKNNLELKRKSARKRLAGARRVSSSS